MWEAHLDLVAGPWLVRIRFDDVSTADAFAAAFTSSLLVGGQEAPAALGVRYRAGVGFTLFHGALALWRSRDVAGAIEGLAWFLASLGDARRGVGDTTDLRVVVGARGAVLLGARRPTYLGAVDWRRAGLVELPLLAVRVDARTGEVVLPSPSSDRLGTTGEWAGRRLALLGVVVATLEGELRDGAIARARCYGVGARELLERLVSDRRFASGGQRPRVVAKLLALSKQ